MENLIALNILTERPCIRTDQVSELDLVIELVAGGASIDSLEFKKQSLNLAIVIDRSGSMSGTKLETAKRSCVEILNRLNNSDLFTVVVYDGEAQVIINPKTNKEEIAKTIQSIQPGGQTNLSLGWYLGLLELQTYLNSERINKLILISDGLANEGETKKSVLGKRASSVREEFGIITSTIGIGDDFDEELLYILSKESGGRFWYIKDSDINDIIEEEFKGTLNTLFDSPKIEVTLPKGISISKELNELRKILGKYSLTPITGSYENSFAIRLEIDPKLIDDESLISVSLYNRGSAVKTTTKSLSKVDYTKFITSRVDPSVLETVKKFEKSKTEEKLIETLESGDFDFMKSMIVKEVDGMKKAIDSMEDERIKSRMLNEMGDLENMHFMPEIIEKLEKLNSVKYKNEVSSFIVHCKKNLYHQMHRSKNMHMWGGRDSSMQIDFLERTLLLLENLLEDYPNDLELQKLKNEIDDLLEKNK